MVDQEVVWGATAPTHEWPASPEVSLALNRMGTFDWNLDTGLMHLDASGLEVFDLLPHEYDLRPTTLALRVPAAEGTRLDALVAQALKNGSDGYGVYFRTRSREGTLRWAHTQGRIQRDAVGRPYRIIGVVRDATGELDHSAERLALDDVRRRQTSVVEETTAALAHARTVADVIDVLQDSSGMGRLGATSLVMGLVEGSRIHLVAEGQPGSFVPGTEYTRLDQNYPMSEVVRTLTPRYITSRDDFADSYPLLWPDIAHLNISAAAYLPLIAQGRPIGAIGLLYSDKEIFTPDERNLVVALGSSIAQSLKRAMLYDQEHDLAKSLQQAMLPRSIPSVSGTRIAVRYRSARLGRDIGGDWYDVIRLPGGRVGAVIGDVQGHDTHATAVMGQLRIVLRAYAAEGHAPATVMARASLFLQELDTDRFATCIYAEADPSTGVLQVVRAGHIDPLLRQTDGTCRQVLVPGGLPLGLSVQFGRLEYPVTPVELEPGETLLMCTDGLVEQPGGDLDDGLRLFAELVRQGPYEIEELADHLCEVLGERSGEDDMALLLLRREGTETPGLEHRLHQYIAPADPEALSVSRHTICAAVRTWGARERSDEIELVVDELVTNALLHTDDGATVTVRLMAGAERRLRLDVADRSSTLPRRREPGEAGVSGRGLLLVDRLADIWGVESRGTGKSVWCEFVLPDRPTGHSAHRAPHDRELPG
ncbi:SpoIIE family protein phosphatase [Streptomyces sp. H27-D2]|uniref:SpoIIE family protein phosphatase n=1 Tax=Streptomyces sp. H27-D2 TaxID=3046304 RepID=UPI002DB66BFF|nr:SpoIIE family protein phosphatase [Streptomyces sp. H27-D2]MEC4019559.1 SpoIIE family protein phosphatase [Streptomyces sp. H27-D2]